MILAFPALDRECVVHLDYTVVAPMSQLTRFLENIGRKSCFAAHQGLVSCIEDFESDPGKTLVTFCQLVYGSSFSCTGRVFDKLPSQFVYG